MVMCVAIENREILIKRLSDNLKASAQLVGTTRNFWINIAEMIVDGKVDGIDPRLHFRNPKSNRELAKIVHKYLLPDKQMTPELESLYLGLVREILDGLDFRRATTTS